MATQLDNDSFLSQGTDLFEQALPQYYKAVLDKFCRLSRSFVHFHLSFFAIFSVTILAIFLSLSTLSHSSLIAVSISSLFLIVFSYLILLFYFQAKKGDQLLALKEEFLSSCLKIISPSRDLSGHHLAIAGALTRLSHYLNGFEWEIYKTAPLFPPSTAFLSRFSAFCYWEDVFQLKQHLLIGAIEEHLKQIRETPTDLEVHASLASTYVTLAKLYRHPIQSSNHPREARGKKLSLALEEKAHHYARLAIEEFKILSAYASSDPWIHEQMAIGYQHLNIPEEEIKQVEILAKLRPQDKEILFRLGALYFSQGMNARGLQVYEELKKTQLKKAEELIALYTIYQK